MIGLIYTNTSNTDHSYISKHELKGKNENMDSEEDGVLKGVKLEKLLATAVCEKISQLRFSLTKFY